MPEQQAASWRRHTTEILLGLCLVATAFSIIMGGLTLFSRWQWYQRDPLNAETLVTLRDQVANGETDETTLSALRAADLNARQTYFSLRQRMVSGGWLMLGGVIIAVCAWGLRTVVKKPAIPPAPPRCSGMSAIEMAQARGAITGATIMLIAVAIVAALSARSPLGEKPKTEDRRQRTEDQTNAEMLSQSGPKEPTTNNQEPRTQNQEPTYWSPTFRGVGGSGLTGYGNLPASWNEEEKQNILWRHDLPLPGWASPVVSGERVIVIGANAQQREVTCVHAETGQRLWSTTVPPHADATADYQPDTMDDRWDTLVFAGATPAVTDKQAFALFSNGQLVALDLETGDVQWQIVPAKTGKNPFGLDNALLTYKDSVIVVVEGDERFIARYDAATGREQWRTEREHPSWASPILVDGEQPRVVLLTDPNVTVWDPETGNKVWSTKVLRKKPDYVVGPSPVHVDGKIFVNCQNSGIYALSLADGSMLWKIEQLPDRQGFADGASMVSDGKHLFQFFEFFLTCIDMETGNVVKQREVDAFAGYASPAADSGRLYLFGDTHTLVVDANHESDFAVLGKGELADNLDASPAIVDGRIFLRTDKALYAIGSNTDDN
jgi:outer membrane protein assembly factor BamB